METNLEIYSDSTVKYIENIRTIVKWFNEQLVVNNGADFYCEPVNYSNLEVNPYKCKLTQGIVIEFYYGFPFMLWTKFGSVRIHGSNHHYNSVGSQIRTSIVKQLIELFGCTLLIDKSVNFIGEIGPVYQIGLVGQSTIPNVIYDKSNYIYEYDHELVNKVRQMINFT